MKLSTYLIKVRSKVRTVSAILRHLMPGFVMVIKLVRYAKDSAPSLDPVEDNLW